MIIDNSTQPWRKEKYKMFNCEGKNRDPTTSRKRKRVVINRMLDARD